MVAGIMAAAAVAPLTPVAPVSVFTFAEVVLVASAAPDQRRVAHAADDVFHSGTLGTEVFIGQTVQVERG